MQQRDDQPPVSSRPSLLSAEQQAEVERTLAARTATPPVPARPSRSKSAWLLAGAAAMVCAGAAWWMMEDARQPAVMPATQAISMTTVPGSNGKVPTEAEVSAAAILGENQPATVSGFSLKDLLSAPAGTTRGGMADRDELSKLLEAPSVAAATVTLANASVEKARPAGAPQDKPEPVDEADKGDKGDKAESPDKADKAEKADKADKAEKADQPDAADKADKAGGDFAALKGPRNKGDARLAAAKNAGGKLAQATPKQKGAQKVAQAGTARQKNNASKTAQKPLTREQKAREAKLAAAKKSPAKAAPKPARAETVDSDVALITALVTHSQRERKVQQSLARAFRECKTQAPAQAEKCKARVCSGQVQRDGICKASGLVKAGPVGAVPN